ncbi:MAG: protein translocase subunit SecD [Paracoccaceae bacterium]
MLHTPLWKKLTIWLVVLLGIVYAVPNLFYSRVETHNDAVTTIERDGLETPELAADRALWPDWLPSSLMNLGLDLRGGAHLLAEVKVADVYADRMNGMWPELRDALRAERNAIGNVRRQPFEGPELRVEISNPAGMARAIEVARGLTAPVVSLTGVGSSDFEVRGQGNLLVMAMSEAEIQATDDRTMQQSVEIVRRRVDEVGTREPTIQRQGDDRILIQVPGIGSAAELKELIGTTARLTFHPVTGRTTDGNAAAGVGKLLLPSAEEEGQFYILDDTAVVSGEDLVDAKPDFDRNGRPSVSFRFNPTGARAFGDYTANNVGQLFAIVLDNQVISAPQIQEAIPGGTGQITGNFDVAESTNLAVLLRAGALPAEMTFLEERTVGPELGQDSIDAGKRAAIIGMIAVALYMTASYGWFGVMANVALAINLVLLVAVLSAIGATLTLPGIAGIVLTIGMAVDANVLIYERIREELRDGKGPAASIAAGFDRAFSAIMDSNITAIITGIIMFYIGSGPVRGFAVTLMIGILTSMFTAVYVTRLIIETWIAWRRPKTIVV